MKNCEIHFGICPQCGGDGAGDPSPSSADVPPLTTTRNGVKLYPFRGQWWCEICIKEKEAREQSERKRDGMDREEKFRSNVGFVNQVADE